MIYIRGDFAFCPNPLSADTYNMCPYDCVFCFTKIAEKTYLKNKVKKGLKPYKDHNSILKKAFASEKEYSDPTIKFLRERFPVIIGRKSEPFCPQEKNERATLKLMRELHDYGVPIALETKGIIPGEEYFELISFINISVTPGEQKLHQKLEAGTPSYEERFKMAKDLSDRGIWVGIKAEPIISTVNDLPGMLNRFARACKDANVKHVNFGDLRITKPIKLMDERFKTVGLDLKTILKEKLRTWRPIGEYFFSVLKKRGLKVTSPDWVNFYEQNDYVSCCGLPTYHYMNMVYAAQLIKKRGKVSFKDIKDPIWDKKSVEKMRGIWNSKGDYYTPKDLSQVERIGKDLNGDSIYMKNPLKKLWGI